MSETSFAIIHRLSRKMWDLENKIVELKAIVNKQAEDPGLWSFPVDRPQYIAEAHLQQELRKLHEEIEKL